MGRRRIDHERIERLNFDTIATQQDMKEFCKELGVNLLSSYRRRLKNLISAAPARASRFHATVS
jgi:hypothetical protein